MCNFTLDDDKLSPTQSRIQSAFYRMVGASDRYLGWYNTLLAACSNKEVSAAALKAEASS